MPSQDVCLSVRLSHASTIKTARDILRLFTLLGSRAILVFPYQMVWQYSDGDSPNGGIQCKGYEKIAIFDHYLALSRK